MTERDERFAHLVGTHLGHGVAVADIEIHPDPREADTWAVRYLPRDLRFRIYEPEGLDGLEEHDYPDWPPR
jgi:CRISPR type IV-associated protein Csf3